MTTRFYSVCRKANEAWDDKDNNVVALEELSELQKEICKRMRGTLNPGEMAEEIADVQIVIEKLIQRYNLRELVHDWREEKIDRLEKKIGGRA